MGKNMQKGCMRDKYWGIAGGGGVNIIFGGGGKGKVWFLNRNIYHKIKFVYAFY